MPAQIYDYIQRNSLLNNSPTGSGFHIAGKSNVILLVLPEYSKDFDS